MSEENTVYYGSDVLRALVRELERPGPLPRWAGIATIEWDETEHGGWTADVDALWLVIGAPDKDGYCAWEINSTPDEESVRGEAYGEAFAKMYAEACAVALLRHLGRSK